MTNTLTRTLPAAAVAGLLLLAPAAGGRAQSADPHSNPAVAAPPANLSDSVRTAVEEALRDELRGEAMYARALKDHGDVRPLSNVVRAERRHVALLEDLLKARGLAIPAHPAGAEAPAYASVKEACGAAVALKTTNVALYDRLLAAGPLPDDVKRVFDHNRVASLDHHKPAFERCAGVATAQGTGRGAGRGAHGCGHGCGHGGQVRGSHGCGHCGGGQGPGGHGRGQS